MKSIEGISESLTAKTILLSLFLFIICSSVEASWFDLKPGPYGVGFSKIEKYDYARIFRSKADYYGNPIEGERARPIQICYWYPAVLKSDMSPMVYGEYSFPYPKEEEFFRFVTQLQARERQNLFRIYQANIGLPLDLMSINMTAVLNAPVADGQFPLLIYSSNLQGNYSENAILCEYLASHGYIVAATHSVGTHEINPVTSQGDLETLISDKEFVLANMRELPFVDKNKLGVLGTEFGGLESLLYTMRNSDIDAMASLMGIFIYGPNFEFIRLSPYYAISNFSVPAMQIYTPGAENIDLSLFESLKYSTRYSVELKQLGNHEFVCYDLLASLVPGQQVENFEGKKTAYEALCRDILVFFNAYIKDDEGSAANLKKLIDSNKDDSRDIVMKFRTGQPLPPTQAQFMAIIDEYGARTASELFYKFRDDNPDHIFFLEAPMNVVGYRLLQANQVDDAITVFKMNTEVYPYSCNVWDSYADGLTARGETELVRQAMRKALEAMPGDTINNEQTKEAIRTHAEQVFGTEEDQSEMIDGGNDNEQ